MKRLLATALLLMPIVVPSAFADTAQQGKMKSCNADAKNMKGDERKAFMKECLSRHDDQGSAAQQAQREKMRNCSAAATDKRGDERKMFMSECLRKK